MLWFISIYLLSAFLCLATAYKDNQKILHERFKTIDLENINREDLYSFSVELIIAEERATKDIVISCIPFLNTCVIFMIIVSKLFKN